MLFLIANYILFFISIMAIVAFSTLLERKIVSYMQFRKGPNKFMFKGLLQTFSDMLKLTFKEMFYLNLNKMLHYSAMSMLLISSMLWLIYNLYELYLY